MTTVKKDYRKLEKMNKELITVLKNVLSTFFPPFLTETLFLILSYSTKASSKVVPDHQYVLFLIPSIQNITLLLLSRDSSTRGILPNVCPSVGVPHALGATTTSQWTKVLHLPRAPFSQKMYKEEIFT